MNRIIFSLKYILGACILTLLGGCYDDTFGYLNGDMADGEVTVSLDACFEPFGEADLTRTMSGGTKGDCMKGLDDLCLLLYDSEGKLVEGFPREITGYDVSDEDRTEGDGAYTDHPIAEASTKHARFTTSIPAGAYYMVAVANLGYGSYNSTYQALVSGKYAGQYSTLHDLRMMKIAWDSENVANNRAMLGYFDSEKSSNPNHGSSFPLIQISSNTHVKAWLRRCVSKITVDIDGSALRDNVYVFIKDVKVKNLVKECNLGFGKLVPQSGNPINYNNAASNKSELLDEALDEQVITFGEGDDFNYWPLITNGTPYITEEVLPGQTADGKAAKPRLNLHTETSPALFFFENMQGNSPYPKVSTADPSNNGRPTGSGNPKYDCDGLPCGTYIEVTAHYRSMNYDNVGEGEIKYRFMIGKDADRNCDAERNSHFKLTLKLRGNANNYEWHVDYKDLEGFDAPNPWYVSYLYNHSSQLPFKYTPPKGWKVVKMEATIIDNPWYPTPEDGKIPHPDGDDPTPYNTKENRALGNGFLALHSPMSEKNGLADGKIVTEEDNGLTDWPGYDNTNKTNFKFNDPFFFGESKSKSTINKSTREYYFDGTADATNEGIESYSYKKEHDQFLDVDKYTFSIPLFTREKVLIKKSGFSGNNPFEPFTRTAKLELKATIQPIGGGETQEKRDTIDVIQVKRLVNPKGVYRRSGNNQDFHVILMERKDINDDEFVETTSDGPWRAEIIGDQGFITLDGKQTVTGATRTAIDFNIRFNKTNSKNSPNKNAIVRVLYNNYTCTHLIFVRQGYDPQKISPNAKNFDGDEVTSAEWYACNLIAEGLPADDPRDEGSMFKFGNIGQPIDAINNVYGDPDGDGDGEVLLQAQGAFKAPETLKLVGKDGKLLETAVKWSDIDSIPTGFGNVGNDFQVAGIRDFEQLYLTQYVQFGYGVLYADGATETQPKVLNAFGYNRHAKNTAIRGMRGVFAYYYNANDPKKEMTGRNMFFPIGRSAYGHRKNARGDSGGVLRYCSNRVVPASDLFAKTAPLFSSLYRREGAIYWAAKSIKYPNYYTWNGLIDADGSTSVAYGLDLNFFSFDVNTISGANVDNGGDACFVRCVTK